MKPARARRARRVIAACAAIVALGAGAAAGALEWRFARGREAVDRAWTATPAAGLADFGATRRLEILPLVDWSVAAPGLQGEAGVSYLIRTDRNTILFDVGLNARGSDPSPLQANMQRLGVSLDDVDTVVVSHPHMDHVGGLRWARAGSFSPGNAQPDLAGKRVFVPVPMRYPGITPALAAAPTVIGPGVATTGAIPAQLYIGRVEEQALVIRVEGRGIVLVVGCGHQGLPRLLERTGALAAEPLYGLVGGLHLPVPGGRIVTAGVDLQKLVVFGPFRGPGAADLRSAAELLASRRPSWVSLSPHDSSDESIDAFRRVFGAGYHDLRVGDWLRISPG